MGKRRAILQQRCDQMRYADALSLSFYREEVMTQIDERDGYRGESVFTLITLLSDLVRACSLLIQTWDYLAEVRREGRGERNGAIRSLSAVRAEARCFSSDINHPKPLTLVDALIIPGATSEATGFLPRLSGA